MAATWPDAFRVLIRELDADRGRPALIDTSSADFAHLISALTPLVDEVVSLGQRVAKLSQPPTVSQLVRGLTAATTLLLDVEVMFAPALQIEVVSQLRRIAQNTALIVAWPGRIANRRLSYSLPGRSDYIDEPARDLVVLRPVDTDFPDDVPYNVEHYPA